VRIVFAATLLFIFAGLAYLLALGVMHR